MEFYERRARELGLTFSEYLVITLADLHGLELPEREPRNQLEPVRSQTQTENPLHVAPPGERPPDTELDATS